MSTEKYFIVIKDSLYNYFYKINFSEFNMKKSNLGSLKKTDYKHFFHLSYITFFSFKKSNHKIKICIVVTVFLGEFHL